MRSNGERRIGRLWRRRDDLIGYLRVRGIEHHAAQDIVSVAYEIAWRRVDELPDDDDLAVGWLYRTASLVTMNHRRAVSRHAAMVRRCSEGDAHAPRSISAAELARIEASDAWASLSDADRRVLAIVAWLAPTHAELARWLDCSIDAASQRVSRARHRLGAAMEA